MSELIAKIKDHCRRGGSASGLRELLNQYPHRYVWKVFVGQAKERVKDIPSVVGTYDTTNWGTLQTYQESTAAVGDVFIRNDGVNDGCVLTVIVNEGTTGDAWMPSTYYYVAIEIPEPPLPEQPCDDDDDDRVNARDEFLKHVNGKTVRASWIMWQRDLDTKSAYALPKLLYILPEGYTPAEYERFLQHIDFTYDAGYGSQEVFGVIWYTDGTSWSERSEYDGREWWVIRERPKIEFPTLEDALA